MDASLYLIRVDGWEYLPALNRLMARVRARAASFRYPEAVVEVEYRPTGERVRADIDGSFCHYEDRYMPDGEAVAWALANMNHVRVAPAA